MDQKLRFENHELFLGTVFIDCFKDCFRYSFNVNEERKPT